MQALVNVAVRKARISGARKARDRKGGQIRWCGALELISSSSQNLDIIVKLRQPPSAKHPVNCSSISMPRYIALHICQQSSRPCCLSSEISAWHHSDSSSARVTDVMLDAIATVLSRSLEILPLVCGIQWCIASDGMLRYWDERRPKQSSP